MGRPLRSDRAGFIYHVLNRANGRATLFRKESDYEAFERVLGAAHERTPIGVLAYCLMPNHWHLLLQPRRDGDLSRFVGWLTLTHTQRWHAHCHNTGSGHLYQGRFKSFPVEKGDHFLAVCRYVERNGLRAGLVRRAEAWRWCSLWRRSAGDAAAQGLLGNWPVRVPAHWTYWVNQPQNEAEVEAVRRCVTRGRPFGSDAWVARVARDLGLEVTLRPRGRPKNKKKGS